MATLGHVSFHQQNRYGVLAIYLIGAILVVASIFAAAATSTSVEQGVSEAQAVMTALR